MKENRCVAYRVLWGYDKERKGDFLNKFKMLDTKYENCRGRMYEVFQKSIKGIPNPIDLFVADFGAREKKLPTGEKCITGLVVLAISINGVEQSMPLYNLVSGVSMEEIESKRNNKMDLTPEEIVDEIKYSTDRFFLITTNDLRFPDQLIDTEQLDTEFRLGSIDLN